ncbi:5087_t:CDS:1 [Diversispora eburnea]|uniref:5087_t:CDS:1 n=1 Tax=Diversispora eburnea TaxID=1213867 RepID=A0A9N8V0R8_9GLOM|nr:5087_t:CDS:1 [Diversispora eburnea]
MDEDQQNIHVQRIMDESEEREIRYLKCIIKSGYLEFEWSIITPSKWDWIGLYENNSKENTDWLNGHWFYISNHSHRETLTDGRYSFTGTHWIGTVSGQNQIRLNTYESYNVHKTYAHLNVLNPDFAHFDKFRVHYVKKGLQHLFSRHKTDWGFNQDDNWNSRNREKLLETLQEFTNRNENNVNVYLGTYKNQSVYLVIDHTSYQCLMVYRGGEKDYFLLSGWVLSEDQYKYVTKPPYKLSATVLLVYEDILEQIANSEGERDDLIKQYLRIYLNDKNRYDEKVYCKGAEFFGLAESYIPLSFEGRDEITPEDNYELDFEKIREKAGTILGELEKITL